MRTKRAIILSFIFASIIMTVPWEKLNGAPFSDKLVYLDYAQYGVNRINYVSFDTIYSYVFNEWLWHYILLNVEKYISYINFFNSISFLSLFSIAFYLLKRHRVYSLILLINPLVIDLVMSQYRISLAMSIILLSVHIKSKSRLKIILIFIASLIHTSVLLFIFTYCAILLIWRLFSHKPKLYLALLIFLGMSISIALSGAVNIILESVGDRRAEYAIDGLSSSIGYLSFWILNLFILIYFFVKHPVKNMKQSLSLVVLSDIAFNAIFGGYSTRILSVMFPVIMSTNLHAAAYQKLLILMFFSVYSYLQWIYWLNY